MRLCCCCGEDSPSSELKARSAPPIDTQPTPQPTLRVSAKEPLPKQEPQIPDVPKSLPSQVDDTLGECARFRILLVGKSGAGKSSLIADILNIDRKKIDIAHKQAGRANIEDEYKSPENPRFILHDSVGFEPGSDAAWNRARNWIITRQGMDLPEKIHAIWLCVVTPRPGLRLLQRGDEHLLQLAKDFNIPIIAVFTKYDQLVTHFRQEHDPLTATESAEEKAAAYFNESAVMALQDNLKDLKLDLSIPCVQVAVNWNRSAKYPYQETLINLTKFTRNILQPVEHKLQVLWVAAQQVNALQKVEGSISGGFKKYWLDLGQSSAFEDQILINCIHRLHADVLKIWNFNDPTGILSGINFFTMIIGLTMPLVEKQGKNPTSPTGYVPDFGQGGARELVSLLQDHGLSLEGIVYLYKEYEKFPSTAKLLATYIVNLILVLYGIFADTLPSEPPRELSNGVILEVVEHHKISLRNNSLDDIDQATDFAQHPEWVIQSEISKRLPVPLPPVPDDRESGDQVAM